MYIDFLQEWNIWRGDRHDSFPKQSQQGNAVYHFPDKIYFFKPSPATCMDVPWLGQWGECWNLSAWTTLGPPSSRRFWTPPSHPEQPSLVLWMVHTQTCQSESCQLPSNWTVTSCQPKNNNNKKQQTWCLTSTETPRLIREGEKREILYLSLHCHHQNDSCIIRWAAMRAILMFH